MTALELKEQLRRIDVDANGLMALLEYLLFKYNRSVALCINNPQGGTEEDKRKLQEATDKCEALQKALDDLQIQLARQREDEKKALAAERAAKFAEEAARAAEASARSAERIAKDAETAAKFQEDILKRAEDVVRAAENEARAADADLKRQQDEFKNSCAALEAKINNPATGQVAKGTAVQQLAALKGADPLPLRKAKITQEAAVRKVEAERKIAEGERKKAQAVREKAEEDRVHAEAERAKAVSERERAEGEREMAVAARKLAEEQTKRVEEAVADTEQKAKEANDYLEELKKRPTVAHGSIWWMQRQVTEARKYMPRSKQ